MAHEKKTTAVKTTAVKNEKRDLIITAAPHQGIRWMWLMRWRLGLARHAVL
jgi:hypothetical protein